MLITFITGSINFFLVSRGDLDSEVQHTLTVTLHIPRQYGAWLSL